MSKKLFLAIGLAIAIIFSFSVTLSFATENTMQNAGNDVVNGVRDVVGGAENAVEDALKGVGDGINDMTNMETLWIDDEKTNRRESQNNDTNKKRFVLGLERYLDYNIILWMFFNFNIDFCFLNILGFSVLGFYRMHLCK